MNETLPLRTSEPVTMQTLALILLIAAFTPCLQAKAGEPIPAITFNKNFEGGCLGKLEKLSETEFRCWVEGQHDEHGRNRQANWYFFRMDHLAGREITLTLTDFVGEYNDKPGACPMNGELRPVFSDD